MSTCLSSIPVELFNIHILLSQTLTKAPSTLNLNNPEPQLAYSTEKYILLKHAGTLSIYGIFAVFSMYQNSNSLQGTHFKKSWMYAIQLVNKILSLSISSPDKHHLYFHYSYMCNTL